MADPTTSQLLAELLLPITNIQSRFLPEHTREHIDEALRLIAIAHEELRRDSTGATCLVDMRHSLHVAGPSALTDSEREAVAIADLLIGRPGFDKVAAEGAEVTYTFEAAGDGRSYRVALNVVVEKAR